MKRKPSMTDGAAERWQRQRFNPWRGVTPDSLSRALDEFDAGWLRKAALMWDNRVERDEALAAAVPKRCASVARLPWSIITEDESPRAAEHVEALQDFFTKRIEATDSLDLDQRGGMRMLVEQTMEAAFTRKAAHEIIWRPGRLDIAAELRCVPLYFFEQLSGRLRYTGPEMTTTGQDLQPGGWMITARRRGLMKAALMCAMLKGLALSDWITYSEKFAMPGIHGEIDAAPDSPEWVAFEEAVAAYAAEMALVSRSGAKINLIEASSNPNAPYEPMVERMTRLILILCRGADLGSLSSQDGTGASLQDGESNLLLEDDAKMVSESLQRHLARPVIWHLFGEEPLAYIELQVPADEDTKAEIEVDTALKSWGIEQDPAVIAERYGRTIAAAAESAAGGVRLAENDASAADNPEDDEAALGTLSLVLKKAVSDTARTRLYVAIRDILTADETDGEYLAGRIAYLRDHLPEWLGKDPAAELAFQRFAAAATLAGWSENPVGVAAPLRGLAAAPEPESRVTTAENDKRPLNRVSGGLFGWLRRAENSGNSEGARKGWETRRRNGWTSKRYREALAKGDELAEFYNKAISGSGAEAYETMPWATVDGREAAALEAHTGLSGLRGLRHEIDSYAARHIHKQHGDPEREEPRGQVAVTPDDIRNLPRHIALAQVVEYGGKTRQGRDTIRYFHQEKGTTVVIEEVRKKSLTPASIRKFKGRVGPGEVSDENMPPK